jgi:DNA-binding HxlR family transcriptional regulator
MKASMYFLVPYFPKREYWTEPLSNACMKFQINEKKFICPMELTMDVLGGKWKLLLLWQLRLRAQRYGDLRRLLEGITNKMLTQQLRELERDGIVHREVFQVIPPKVEYSLTEKGARLLPVLTALGEWGLQFEVEDGEPSICD